MKKIAGRPFGLNSQRAMSEPASGGGLNGDNDEATSEQVANAWRVVGKRLLAEGYDPEVVTETMLTVALKSWAGLRTRTDAVRRLRSLADQLEQDRICRGTSRLSRGRGTRESMVKGFSGGVFLGRSLTPLPLLAKPSRFRSCARR